MSKILVSHVAAKDLMTDDCFKMAGQMYRITSVRKCQVGSDRVINFLPLLDRRLIGEPRILIVPKRTMFKVYNRQ